ncbi:MAG: serine hydrolase [Flammeovirgaceae bacterium]|jgi:CubicO group peptidase (beta-lactamase class C family)|nr:serine hydrolase [Flammeovirgaceae bacterium]|tara:strand:- start:30733 stop:31812 length:1080 start_codon:yes stop_codon:yes gene_type:complete
MRGIKVYVLSLLLSSCYFTEDPKPQDQQDWPYATPEEIGLNNDYLFNINNNLLDQYYQNVNSLVIIKEDQLIFENYYLGQSRDSINNLNTATNILASIAIGMAIDDGYLISIETPIFHFLPEYEAAFSTDSLKKTITVSQLLSHRSGLSWNEVVSQLSDQNDLIKMLKEDDWTKYVLDKRLESIPDSRYNLNNGGAMIISKIIQNITGEPFANYVNRRLFEPLDIKKWTWDSDLTGTTNATTGLSLNQLDFTKIGYLFLKKGFWKGESVLSEDWIIESTAPKHQLSNLYDIGYLWYQFSNNANFIDPLNNQTYYVPGGTGYHLYVNPNKNAVVCIGADNYNFGIYSPSMILYLNLVKSI